jgi:hypothetical protein
MESLSPRPDPRVVAFYDQLSTVTQAKLNAGELNDCFSAADLDDCFTDSDLDKVFNNLGSRITDVIENPAFLGTLIAYAHHAYETRLGLQIDSEALPYVIYSYDGRPEEERIPVELATLRLAMATAHAAGTTYPDFQDY